jgi:Cof subfamily protein (haloacid dehalogenase superfamily)
VARVALLLADVDGTLVTQEKVLTQAAKEAVAALRQAGIRFAITSGRPPRGMAMLTAPLGIDTPVAGFNGGVLVRPDLSVLARRSIDPDAARAALDLIRVRRLDAWLYTETEWMVLKQDAPHVAREAWTMKFEPKVVDAFADADLARAIKIVGVSDDADRVAGCETEVQDTLGGRVSATRSQPYYLDVTHPDANKGAVVRLLSDMLGIPAEAIAVIGDSPNDVLMFREAGLSIAMGNASDAVKAQATAVTASNETEGFARAVHDIVLGGRA